MIGLDNGLRGARFQLRIVEQQDHIVRQRALFALQRQRVAMNAYKSYGISAAQADKALQAVEAAVMGWRAESNRFGIPKAEQALMAGTFEG